MTAQHRPNTRAGTNRRRTRTSGPRPLPPHLVLRHGRASVGGKRRGEPAGGRKHVGPAYWYIKDGPKLKSTLCSEEERHKAEAELSDYIIEKHLGPDRSRRSDLERIQFKDAILDHCNVRTKLARTPALKRRADKVRQTCVRLLEFFGDMPLLSYRPKDSTDFVAWYLEQRRPHYENHPDDVRSPRSTADNLLRLLCQICKAYSVRHDIGWSPDIQIPKEMREHKKPKRWLRRAELARLLWACRGRRWDMERDCWQTRTYQDADGTIRTTRIVAPRRVIERRRGLTRAIRIGCRLGPRKEVYELLTWGRRFQLPSLEVDDDGIGYLHRRGYAEADTAKSRETSDLPQELECMAWIWKRQDGQSKRTSERERARGGLYRPVFKHVIRTTHGKPLLHFSLAAVARDAGLRPGISTHILKHTAVEYAYQMGVGLENAAKMLGTSPKTLLTYYTDWGSARGIAAKAAFDDRAARARVRSREFTGPEADDRIRRYDRPFAAAAA